MKKFMLLQSVLLTLCLLFGTACGGSGGTSETVSSGTSSSASSSGASSGTSSFSADAVDTSDLFSKFDQNESWDDSATKITLSDAGCTVSGSGAAADGSVVTISAGGTYLISGTLSDGQLIVAAGESDKVQLVFNTVQISCATSAPVWIQTCDKTVLTLAPGTVNTLSDAQTYTLADGADEPDACLFSKQDLTLNGSGTLNVTGNYNNGIGTKDDLRILSCTLNVTAQNNAVKGKDSTAMQSGTLNLTAGNDGIQVSNETDADKGFFYMADGDVTITADGDGIQAVTLLSVEGGAVTVTVGGGSENGAAHTDDFGGKGGNFGGMGGFGGFGTRTGGTTDSTGAVPAMPTDGTVSVPAMPDATTGAGGSAQGAGGFPGGFPGGSTVSALTPPDGTASVPSGGTVSNPGDAQIDTSSEENSTKGLKCSGTVSVSGGSVTVNAADDAVHSNNTVLISGGTLALASGDDGIHADSVVTISGGDVNISTSYEGIEGCAVTVSGGTIHLCASDDGFNASDGSGSQTMGKGGMSASSNALLTFTGGTCVVNATGDGLDSNGSIVMTGGTVLVYGPADNGNGAIDYGDGAGASFTLSGGTLLALGSSGMAQTAQSDTQGVLTFTCSSISAETVVSITDSNGKEVISFINPYRSFDCVVYSAPALSSGETYTVSSGGSETAAQTDGVYAAGGYSGGSALGSMTLS